MGMYLAQVGSIGQFPFASTYTLTPWPLALRLLRQGCSFHYAMLFYTPLHRAALH